MIEDMPQVEPLNRPAVLSDTRVRCSSQCPIGPVSERNDNSPWIALRDVHDLPEQPPAAGLYRERLDLALLQHGACREHEVTWSFTKRSVGNEYRAHVSLGQAGVPRELPEQLPALAYKPASSFNFQVSWLFPNDHQLGWDVSVGEDLFFILQRAKVTIWSIDKSMPVAHWRSPLESNERCWPCSRALIIQCTAARDCILALEKNPSLEQCASRATGGLKQRRVVLPKPCFVWG